MIRKTRAPAGWRAPFLLALARGLSIAEAARAAGIDPASAHRARARDPVFGAEWARARAEGAARLVADGAVDERGTAPALAPDQVVRGAGGARPRITRAGPGRWSAAREAAFLETLAATANVSAACRAAGVSATAVYARRERDAGFAARWRSALDHGYHRLEALLLEGATFALGAGAAAASATARATADAAAARMTVDQAITVWRMHQARVTGAGRPPRHDWRRTPAPLEEIQAEVLRRVRAMGG